MPAERLQKIISRAGVASRRHAEELILNGEVQVNGKTIRELGTKADPDQDRILVQGRRLRISQKFQYFIYHKPPGIVVSKKDELGRKGIFDILKLPKAVNAVGRLDKDSEGLLLLTDDGEFLQRYTHPSFDVSKVYQVQVDRKLNREELHRLKTGIRLGNKTVHASKLKIIKRPGGFWLEMELKEGIKREIRRMFQVLGVKTLRLIRVLHGSVKLGTLKAGECKELKQRPT